MGTRILVTLAGTGLALWAAAALAQDAAAPAGAPPSTAPAPAPETPASPPPATTLRGLPAWEQIKGNTIEGKVGGDTFAEYFDPSGAVKYVDKDGLSKGTWTVQNEKVCFDFPEDDDRSCSTFAVTGDEGTITDQDGSTVRFRISKGNNKGL